MALPILLAFTRPAPIILHAGASSQALLGSGVSSQALCLLSQRHKQRPQLQIQTVRFWVILDKILDLYPIQASNEQISAGPWASQGWGGVERLCLQAVCLLWRTK